VLTIAAGLEALLSRNNCWPVCLFIQWSERSSPHPLPGSEVDDAIVISILSMSPCYSSIGIWFKSHLIPTTRDAFHIDICDGASSSKNQRKSPRNSEWRASLDMTRDNNLFKTIICPSRRHDHFPTFCELAWSSDIIVHFVQLHSVSHCLASFLWVQS